jgi:hypothetical protein
MNQQETLKGQINAKVAEVCEEIAYQPMLYFSEADIQQLLVERLRQIPELSEPLETSVPRGKEAKGKKYKTSRIHREYGAGEGRRFDVVIFSPENVKAIDCPNLECKKDYLKPQYVFELGTEKTADILTHFRADLDKLKEATEIGYLIQVYRDPATSRSDTGRRAKTCARIWDDFVSVFERDLGNMIVPSNVRVLAMLLSPFRDQTRTWGKCSVFDVENNAFKKIGIENRDKKLTNSLLKQLNMPCKNTRLSE